MNEIKKTIISFDKLYRKSLQDNIIDETEYESLCNIFTKYVDENENDFFCKFEHKNKIKFLVIIN